MIRLGITEIDAGTDREKACLPLGYEGRGVDGEDDSAAQTRKTEEMTAQIPRESGSVRSRARKIW